MTEVLKPWGYFTSDWQPLATGDAHAQWKCSRTTWDRVPFDPDDPDGPTTVERIPCAWRGGGTGELRCATCETRFVYPNHGHTLVTKTYLQGPK